jgi:hypothetical protein
MPGRSIKNMIVSEDFIRHFDACNDYEMREDLKKEFYELKSLLLKNFASFVGYDLQKYRKYTIGCYGDVFTVDEHYAYKEYMNHRCSEPRWASTHRHILERYNLFFTRIVRGKEVKGFKIYNIPTDEYSFKCDSYCKESLNYAELRKQVLDKVGLKKQKRARVVDPEFSLYWLKEYFKENNIKALQIPLEFAEETAGEKFIRLMQEQL